MLWHKVFHRIAYDRMVSLSHPHRWMCSCGKVWLP